MKAQSTLELVYALHVKKVLKSGGPQRPGPGASNVIPSSVEMLGTIRALTHARFADLRKRVCPWPLLIMMCATAIQRAQLPASGLWSCKRDPGVSMLHR